MKSYADHTEAEWASLTETEKNQIIEADMDRKFDEAQAEKKATYAAITTDPKKAAAHKETARKITIGDISQWVGDGYVTVDGGIYACPADLGDEVYEAIEAQIESGLTEGETHGYTWAIID